MLRSFHHWDGALVVDGSRTGGVSWRSRVDLALLDLGLDVTLPGLVTDRVLRVGLWVGGRGFTLDERSGFFDSVLLSFDVTLPRFVLDRMLGTVRFWLGRWVAVRRGGSRGSHGETGTQEGEDERNLHRGSWGNDGGCGEWVMSRRRLQGALSEERKVRRESNAFN